MSKEWFSGPPPSIGWWPASINKDRSYLRWWNGEYWSLCCKEGDLLHTITTNAKLATFNHSTNIKWAKRPMTWPLRSYT